MTSQNNPTPKEAWGKLILLGEHAVVYGHTALAGAMDRGIRTTITSESFSGPSRLRVPAWNIDLHSEDCHPVAYAFRAILEKADALGGRAFTIRAKANIAPAAGLGSSAALCVAIARCFSHSLEETTRWANAGEACFHDSPSGVDVALSAQGGIGTYCKTTGFSALSCPSLPLVVALSGVDRSTADMVRGVASRLKANPGLTALLEDIATTTLTGKRALLDGNWEVLGACMNQCQRNLSDLGVSLNTLDTMVATAMNAGALGAKLTGAGGGGAIIALAPGRESEVATALRQQGFTSFITTLGHSE